MVLTQVEKKPGRRLINCCSRRHYRVDRDRLVIAAVAMQQQWGRASFVMNMHVLDILHCKNKNLLLLSGWRRGSECDLIFICKTIRF